MRVPDLDLAETLRTFPVELVIDDGIVEALA